MQKPDSTVRRMRDIEKLRASGVPVFTNLSFIDLKSNLNPMVWTLIRPPPPSLYAGGVFLIQIELTPHYPLSSPSVGFLTPVIHPNIDEKSGTICLDALNSEWRPIYGLTQVCNVLLPLLLAYPNPLDPLNHAAATLFLKCQGVQNVPPASRQDNDADNEYKRTVRRHIAENATISSARQHLSRAFDADATGRRMAATIMQEWDKFFNSEAGQHYLSRPYDGHMSSTDGSDQAKGQQPRQEATRNSEPKPRARPQELDYEPDEIDI